MTASAILAVYASVVATGALGWQVAAEVLRRRTHVVVRFEEGLLGPRVSIVNKSEHAVRVVEGGVRSKAGDISFGGTHTVFGSQLLGEIPPRDARFARLGDDDLLLGPIADLLAVPTTAWVRLSTGEVVQSPAMSFEAWSRLIQAGIQEADPDSPSGP